MKYRKLDQRGDVSVELVSGEKIKKDMDRIVVMYSKPTDQEVEMLKKFAEEVASANEPMQRYGDKKKGVLVFTGNSNNIKKIMGKFMEMQAAEVRTGASFFIEFRTNGDTAIRAAKSKKLESVSLGDIREIWHVEAGKRGCGESIAASEEMARKLDG